MKLLSSAKINLNLTILPATDSGLHELISDIIPVDTDGDGIGEIVGWRPIARFDLTELQDTTRCIYYNQYEDKIR